MSHAAASAACRSRITHCKRSTWKLLASPSLVQSTATFPLQPTNTFLSATIILVGDYLSAVTSQERESLSPKASLKAMAPIEAAITEGDRPNKVSPHLTAHVILRSSSPLTALAEAQDHDHERYSKRRDDAIDGCLRHV